MADFNGIKTFFLPKDAPKSLTAGAPPQTPLDELTAFYTLLERMEMRGKMNLPPISISWLRHCGVFESHQKLPFWSKMHQNRWRLGLRPRPRLGSLQYTLLERMEMRGNMNLPPISISWLRHCGKFVSHQKLPFWSKMHQNRWRLGLRPRPRLGSLQYTLLERMEMRGNMNLPPISISWLLHFGKFVSHQKLPFWSKMHQNRWRLGLRPRPRWGSLQRSPRPPSC